MREKLGPDTSQWVGQYGELRDTFYIIPDSDHPIGAVINDILARTGSRKRARVVLYEDAARAWGILTPEEAEEVAQRLEIDPTTGNYTDPRLGKLVREFQIKLGLIY